MVAVKAGGVYFNGINAYGEILDSSELNINGDFTLFCRAKLSWLEKSGGLRDIIVKAPGSGWLTANFRLAFDKGAPWRGVTFVHGDGTNYEAWHTWSFQAEFGKEYAIAVNNDGIYVNAELVQSININLNWYQDTHNIRVGLNPSNSAGNCLPGYIRDVMMFNRKLDDAEIESLVKGKLVSDGLLFYIPFTDNNGVIARDLTGNHHCRLHNCRWVKSLRYGMHFYNGGVNFASGVSVDCNYASTVVVCSFARLHVLGSLTQRKCPLHLTGDRLMIWNEVSNPYFRTTNYDGTWKGVTSVVPIEPNQVYTVSAVDNNNEEHLYVVSNGVVVDHNYRTDLGDCGSYNSVDVQIGSNQFGHYNLEGDVFAAFIYNRPISEDEIKQISMNWYNENLIPRDGLVFGCILDRIKYGDVPYDFVNKVYATNIGTPRWNVGKPLRLLQA